MYEGTARPPETWEELTAGLKRLFALDSSSYHDAVEDLVARYISHATVHHLGQRLSPADVWHELTRDLTCVQSIYTYRCRFNWTNRCSVKPTSHVYAVVVAATGCLSRGLRMRTRVYNLGLSHIDPTATSSVPRIHISTRVCVSLYGENFDA
jgi:hypothetical protein